METEDQKVWKERTADQKASPDTVSGVPEDLLYSVDQYGSLVTVEPADWLIYFVPGLQKQ